MLYRINCLKAPITTCAQPGVLFQTPTGFEPATTLK